jgi:hypothetical protein
MIDLLSRARGWLAAREIDDRYLQEHESHAASLASLLAEVRRETLEESRGLTTAGACCDLPRKWMDERIAALTKHGEKP